ncbi:hypothetical protein BCON_0273g00020 [Botryotinia convoluta]|uniref:Uncharacterized protein n=1 Tax=Botryotinia convoluta TaxID=54673 RepID=A0A4Z1HEF4_9HELO|nr:hypothetical protein BCON_0273g00020 [Botryotinia convoluta]
MLNESSAPENADPGQSSLGDSQQHGSANTSSHGTISIISHGESIELGNDLISIFLSRFVAALASSPSSSRPANVTALGYMTLFYQATYILPGVLL